MKVRIYVEGGPKGTHGDGLRRFKNGFKQHFLQLDPRLKNLEVSPCGSTFETIRDYARAVKVNPADCLLALLVDSDAPVTADTPANHLKSKLDSANVSSNARKHVYLMVQCMESWLVTDAAALERYFGNKLRTNVLSKNPDIELEPKIDVLKKLASAIKPTSKGPYQKIQHGAAILAELNPRVVEERSRHARDLYNFLRSSVQN